MAKRQVFFSFEYKKDSWRASQVRNMNKVDDSSTFSDNDWEEVKEKSEEKIKEWIDSQMKMRSCLVVLIGETTANRKWINYEIQKAYELNKGMVGIYIHRLKDNDGRQSSKGYNPFDYLKISATNKPLSDHVKCYNPPYTDSKDAYNYISNNIEDWIETAIDEKDDY